MKKYLIFFILYLVLTGCEEPYTPTIDDTESFIIVDGMLCTKPEKSRVIVTMSVPYSSDGYSRPVSGLNIYATDSAGKRIDFIENGNTGVYFTAKDTNQAARAGNKYTLFIENADGDIFKSSEQLVNECPKITNMYVNSETETILTEDSYGDILEKNYRGTSIYSDTRGILKKNNYYLYKWFGYEEHHSIIGMPASETQVIYRHAPISSAYTSILRTGNADESVNFFLKKNKFIFIPDFTYKNFAVLVPSNYLVYSNTFDGYLFSSEQYSISADAFQFWNDAEKQLEASGKLFDPVSTQLEGNISCVNKPDQFIFGVFYASDVKIRYDYFYINARNSPYARELDSLPELFLDTCSWSLPKGWIFPPI